MTAVRVLAGNFVYVNHSVAGERRVWIKFIKVIKNKIIKGKIFGFYNFDYLSTSSLFTCEKYHCQINFTVQ